MLTILLTAIAAAGLLYEYVSRGPEAGSIVVSSVMLVIIFLLGVQIAAMMYWMRSIMQPLAEVGAATRLMADGHLETFNQIRQADEIGLLGENINDLAVNMQEVLLFIWNHSQMSRELLEHIAGELNVTLEDVAPEPEQLSAGIQKYLLEMYRNNEDLRSIVLSFSYFEIKLENEKMVSDYEQETGVSVS
ncbi:MAG: HAMP domain-containing protein [Candidatus Electrothrix sp. YB6]